MKANNLEIEAKYYIEEECDGLIQYIIRKSDKKIIATLDRFSTEIMEYGSYNDIMETVTCYYKNDELLVLQYFFGWYFNS